MVSLREIEERILANGRVDGPELSALRELLYGDGQIDRKEADYLVQLRRAASYRTPGF